MAGVQRGDGASFESVCKRKPGLVHMLMFICSPSPSPSPVSSHTFLISKCEYLSPASTRLPVHVYCSASRAARTCLLFTPYVHLFHSKMSFLSHFERAGARGQDTVSDPRLVLRPTSRLPLVTSRDQSTDLNDIVVIVKYVCLYNTTINGQITWQRTSRIHRL